MGLSPEERERHLAAREREFASAREQFDARVARFNAIQSEFNAKALVERDHLRAAWADLEPRQKRLAAEWDEANRYQAEQAAALDARAAELDARERAESESLAKLRREAAALREEAAALDARASHARQLVEELEQKRAELQAQAIAPPAEAEPPDELMVALDRAADRDLAKWAAELEKREARLAQERAALASLLAGVSREKAELADRRRVLAEQFEQLAGARAQWQEAESATVAEMEQLARTLRRREAEFDAREGRLVRADARRREDAFELWQLRLRLEAWQAQVVAHQMRWQTEREELEADLVRRERELAVRQSLLPDSPDDGEDTIPLAFPVPEDESPALPAELAALREELERVAAVMLEAGLPEPPESELPWGAEEVPAAPARRAEPDEDEIILFEPPARAA